MSQITQTLPDTLTPKSQFKCDEIQEVWGKLIARRPFLTNIELVDEFYVLGRKDNCQIHMNGKNTMPNVLGNISKEHFRISRDTSYVPYIEDLSKNGTYINGGLIGKGSMSTLCTGDVIAIGNPRYEVFQFHDESYNGTEYGRKYKETRFLGRGAFGEVYLAFSKATCHRYAIKKIQRNRLTSYGLKSNEAKIENEIKILQSLKHPCIIHLEEIINTPDMVYIILDFMEGGELHRKIMKKIRLNEEIAKLYFYQMNLALQYLHKQGITHRDLKPENILLASNDDYTIIKVSDFGLSKIIDEGSVLKSLCGTPMYVAPEILKNNGIGTYTTQVDVWSLGVILYFCLCGCSPFLYDPDDPRSMYVNILKGIYNIPENINKILSDECKDIIKRTLQVDPKKRINEDEIFEHDWLKDDHMHSTFKNLLIEHESKE